MEFFHLLVVAIVFGGLIFWIWALNDCIAHEASTGNDKVVWVLLILFLHFFGALAYVLARRPHRIRQRGK
jgi:hypothetical protein